VDVAGSVALVTGGASGLGAATARRLAALGATVVVLDLPTGAGADLAASLPGGARFTPADVTDAEAVEGAVALAAEAGELRVLVCCAGVGPPAKVVGRDGAPMPLAHFTRILDINLVGTFNAVRLAAARMVGNRPNADGERGVVVMTASIAAFDGQMGQVAYSASKGGIVGMTLPLARDLARDGVRALCIAPGIFDTPLLGRAPQELRDALGAAVPFPPRLGRPDEFAALVEAIIANPMLNGEVIRLDGALRMAPR
jgi:NAD(P)-dependent dehydrogenase (short-subunit alcohol dehydrogenase family)